MVLDRSMRFVQREYQDELKIKFGLCNVQSLTFFSPDSRNDRRTKLLPLYVTGPIAFLGDAALKYTSILPLVMKTGTFMAFSLFSMFVFKFYHLSIPPFLETHFFFSFLSLSHTNFMQNQNTSFPVKLHLQDWH